MENIFLHLLNMSLAAGVLVVAVVLLHGVFHKAPRWLHCLLWALVAVRLLCPFDIESNLSLMPKATVSVSKPDTPPVEQVIPDTPDAPSTEIIVPDAPVTDVPIVDSPVVDPPVDTPPIVDTPPVIENPPANVDPNVGGTITPPADHVVSTPVGTPSADAAVSTATPEASADPWQIVLTVATYVWLAGMAAMAVYAVVTTLRLRRRVGEAAHLEGNLWQCDHIRSPFILGVFRPRVYLPSDLNGAARDSVVAHEQAHLHRRDHWWKPFGFLLLTVYWFNPLMWVAYILLCRDIEAACDERVVRDMNADARRSYSEALLVCSAPRRLVSACPLAFGETSVKSRIKSVLSYKKPTIWIVVAALLVSTVAGVCLLTDPKSDKPAKEPDSQTDITDQPTNPDEDDKGEQPTAPKYAFFVHTGEPKAKVQLELDGNGCIYTNSILSSWAAEGTYEVKGDSIILSFPNDAMTIEFEGDFTGLTLRMGQSDTRMSYDQVSFGGYELKNGAVFKRQTDNRAVPFITPHTISSMSWMSQEKRTAMREQYSYRTGNNSNNDLPIIPITSRAELDAFVAEYGSEMTFPSLAYDDAFFVDKMLAAVYYTDGSCSVNPQIAAVEYSGAELVTLQVDVYEPYMQDQALGQWFMLAEISRSVIPYATCFRAVERYHIPTDYYFATYSHPITVGDDQPAMGWYRLGESSDKFRQLVDRQTWHGADIVADTDFIALGYFTFDGVKKYYVSPDGKQLYDGEQIADLTAADAEWLDYYFREGVPVDAATTSVTGTVVEWDKADGYLVLDVTDGDSKLGKRVRVYTSILTPGSAPAVGYAATVYYDGWYQPGDDYSVIYALDRKWMDADLLGDPKPVEKWLDYTVIVKDRDGKPVAGVKVSISSETVTAIATTNSQGVLKFNLPEGVPTGTIEVPQGYIAASKKFNFAAGSTSLTIVLEKEQPVTPPSAAVIFNYTAENWLKDSQKEQIFGSSSVVQLASYDEMSSFLRTYSNGTIPFEYHEYDNAFFEEYALLLTYHETSSGMIRPQVAIYTYSADGTVLSVNIDEFWPSELVTSDIGEWLILSVIKKTDLTGVTKLTSELHAKRPGNSISFLVNPTADPYSVVGEGTKALNSIESDVLNSFLISSMIDEEWGRWTPSSDVLFDVKLVIDCNTYFYDMDTGRIIVTNGYMVHTMAYTMQFSFLPARTNMIEWVVARYSDENDEVWIWEDFESLPYVNAAQPLNTPEMRVIALRTNWLENDSRNGTYDAQYTIGGALYLIDMEHEEVLTADEKQVSHLTKEEVAYLRSVLEAE